ncbi:esterase/lipase family protein [Kitasatospora sp. NPDC018058]|uniref:esterase/lipase family protein n=1 Tax=Kitasatospora sp. NPDC018058 TaxID=3364025 RepID=UPI0037BF21CA
MCTTENVRVPIYPTGRTRAARAPRYGPPPRHADRAWANPGESGTCGAATCPSTGLAQYLAGTGRKVFAIGFAHKHGDNLLQAQAQAQAVGDALALIRARLGVPQVDVVAWSKGEVAARAYVSSVRPSWGRTYAGDARRLVTLGGPNGGLDYVYAHGWDFDLATWPACGGTANAPSPHLSMACYGTYTAQPCLGVLPSGGYDCYPGQRQLLARWDGTYGVTPPPRTGGPPTTAARASTPPARASRRPSTPAR